MTRSDHRLQEAHADALCSPWAPDLQTIDGSAKLLLTGTFQGLVKSRKHLVLCPQEGKSIIL